MTIRETPASNARRNGCFAPHAAAQLARNGDRRSDGPDGVEIALFASEGRVEIDDCEDNPRPSSSQRLANAAGITGIDGLLVGLALAKSDDFGRT